MRALEWWALAPEELHPPREVLVRVHSTPITAPDLMFLQGRYGEQRALPDREK